MREPYPDTVTRASVARLRVQPRRAQPPPREGRQLPPIEVKLPSIRVELPPIDAQAASRIRVRALDQGLDQAVRAHLSHDTDARP